METQLFFSISILPSIALKRWYFSENMNVKGKVVAKFLWRNQFLSLCNSWKPLTIITKSSIFDIAAVLDPPLNRLTVKQCINHEAIQKVFHLHNGIFHSINLCHTFSILLYHLPLGYSLKTNYGMTEKKNFCIYGCFSVSRFIKGGRKSCLYTQLHF